MVNKKTITVYNKKSRLYVEIFGKVDFVSWVESFVHLRDVYSPLVVFDWAAEYVAVAGTGEALQYLWDEWGKEGGRRMLLVYGVQVHVY